MKLILGDCIEKLKELPENSIDAVVTDPPYDLVQMTKRWGKEGQPSCKDNRGEGGPFSRTCGGFMGKLWDGTGIAFKKETWIEVLRVLKPGGHLLSFGGTRTYHRMACAIEDAGFEIRDCIMWVYGSGFPKSLNISKAIEKEKGVKPIGKIPAFGGISGKELIDRGWHNVENALIMPPIQTEEAKNWNGFGTALKPAVEPIVLARKPLGEKTVAENVLKYGTGGINIDQCRVEFQGNADYKESTNKNQHADFGTKPMTGNNTYGDWSMIRPKNYQPTGRFPANLIHDGSDEVVGMFPNNKTTPDINYRFNKTSGSGEIFSNRGTYTPRQDEGSAARFFYCAKSSKSERNRGLDDFPVRQAGGLQGRADGSLGGEPVKAQNFHPTVKPISLMRYLCRLITPPEGTVLDPFMGSGSTGIAAKLEGFNFVGIEKEADYMKIAEARIKSWKAEQKLL